jgi:c-di-GMP-binding flagellar brake protein YcgR
MCTIFVPVSYQTRQGETPVKEQRRHKRYVIEGMDVKCRMLFATEVRLKDISLSGASIVVDKRLNMGSKYTLKVIDGASELSLNGEVVWVSISGSKKTQTGEVVPLYNAGMRFDNVLTGKGAELMGLLNHSANTQKIVPRLGGVRVKVDANGSIVDYPQAFSIKKISLGGMLMEADRLLEVDKQYPLEISLFKSEGPPLRCTGRVASCLPHPSGNADLFNVGVEFLHLSDTDRLRLERFISRLEE